MGAKLVEAVIAVGEGVENSVLLAAGACWVSVDGTLCRTLRKPWGSSRQHGAIYAQSRLSHAMRRQGCPAGRHGARIRPCTCNPTSAWTASHSPPRAQTSSAPAASHAAKNAT